MYVVFLSVSLLASIAGAICGIGGGVIIKPALDTFGMMDVAKVSFLSGCTVLAMTFVSVAKTFKSKEPVIKLATTLPMALGASIGGFVGKSIFHAIEVVAENENRVGFIQSLTLTILTIGTFVYMAKKSKIKSFSCQGEIFCLLTGIVLGLISSFFGIGGGPVNLVVLSFFFSMDTKEAAVNSLFIIMISQITSLLITIVGGRVPAVPLVYIWLMVTGGLLGGSIGESIHKKISDKSVERLLFILMGSMILLNIYNARMFYGSI